MPEIYWNSSKPLALIIQHKTGYVKVFLSVKKKKFGSWSSHYQRDGQRICKNLLLNITWEDFYLFLVSLRIWEHLSSHRRRTDLLYHLRPTWNTSFWVPASWSWRPVGHHFWEGHRQSGEDDCGETRLLREFTFFSISHRKKVSCKNETDPQSKHE